MEDAHASQSLHQVVKLNPAEQKLSKLTRHYKASKKSGLSCKLLKTHVCALSWVLKAGVDE